MTDKERLGRAYQAYLTERKILNGNSNSATNHVLVMALIRIVNLLEKRSLSLSVKS